MKKTLINTLITTTFVASLSFVATPTVAGTDFYQQQLNQRVLEAKNKLNQAKGAATCVKQKALLREHMQIMQDCMKTCRKMTPKADLTEQERSKWFAERQSIMDSMMQQMIEEHDLNISSAVCDADKK